MAWFVDNLSSIFWVLGLTALGLGVAYWVTRKRAYVVGLAGVAGLTVLVALVAWVWIAFFGVSDSKQIEHNIQDMADAVGSRQIERIFSHISDQFHWGRRNKDDLRNLAIQAINSGDVQQVIVWELETRNVSRKTGQGTALFMVKAKGKAMGNDAGFRCLAEFVLDKDKQWRMRQVRLFPPQTDPTTPEGSGMEIEP